MFLPPWRMKFDFDQLININMMHDNMENEISDFPPQLHAITGNDPMSYQFSIGRVHAFKEVCRMHPVSP